MLSGGGDAAVKRVDGGVKLAGVLWVAAARSGAWERGGGERTGGLGCWGFCKARARERRERRPLQRACHRGGEVSAGGLLWAVWQGEEAPVRAKEGGGEQQGDAWTPARSKRGRLALHGGRAALHSGGGSRR